MTVALASITEMAEQSAAQASGPSADAVLLLLGPTMVQAGDVVHEITNLQARLLCQLAIAAPAALTVEQLLDALWPIARPANAKASLYNQISRLRARLGVDVIRSIGGAYQLEVPTDLDLAATALSESEAFSHDGQPAAAHRVSDDAIAWFRGNPLAELAHDDLRAGVQRRRAAETLRGLCTIRVDAALRCGQFGWAVGEAERLVGETPGDERRWALLVDALRISGRRGDAFAAYERARRHLIDTLGLAPSKLLSAAHDRLLSSDQPTIVRATPLVGREAFIADVIDGLNVASATMIQGESGIGKTRLVEVIGNRLSRSGVRVAMVNASLYSTHAAQILHEIADALDVEISTVGSPIAAFSDTIRRAVKRHRRVVVIVDDADHVGAITAGAFIEASANERVRFILASRSPYQPAVGVSIRVLEVPPLTRADVADIVTDQLAAAGAVAAVPAEVTVDIGSEAGIDWVYEMSGGNPGIAELLTTAQAIGTAAPLNDYIEQRLARLSVPARNTLSLVAVLNAPLPKDQLVLFTPDGGVDEAIAERLLTISDEGVVRFRHGAIRAALYAEMGPGRREDAHVWVLRSLAALGVGAEIIAPQAEAVRHVDPARSAKALLAAATSSAPNVEARTAEQWFATCLDIAQQLIDTKVAGGDELAAAAQEAIVQQQRRRVEH